MAKRPLQPLLLQDELSALRQVGVEKRFAVGDRLVSIGAQSREVFYLLEGAVKIVVIAESGSESVFGLRLPGDLIGEMSMLNDELRSADVVAVEATLALIVPAQRFINYLSDFPSVALALLRMQTRRLSDMTVRSMLGGRSVKARVAQRLLELSGSGERDDGVVKLTQSELAQYVDASREWTSKALGDLRREGAIETARGRMIITDSIALQSALLENG